MSLTDRLARIEARLTALEQRQAKQDEVLTMLVDALEDEAAGEAASGMTLDGGDAGGERDQSQSLDG